MTYEELAIDQEDLMIKEINFTEVGLEDLSGLCINDKIYINSNLETTIEKKCILAEEIGHYNTSYGNILNQNDIRNIKQEKRARNWAYEKLIPLDKFIKAYNSGIRNRHELADFLDVIEEFLEEAILYYNKKYGICTEFDGYIIYFDPLGVLKLF